MSAFVDFVIATETSVKIGVSGLCGQSKAWKTYPVRPVRPACEARIDAYASARSRVVFFFLSVAIICLICVALRGIVSHFVGIVIAVAALLVDVGRARLGRGARERGQRNGREADEKPSCQSSFHQPFSYHMASPGT